MRQIWRNLTNDMSKRSLMQKIQTVWLHSYKIQKQAKLICDVRILTVIDPAVLHRPTGVWRLPCPSHLQAFAWWSSVQNVLLSPGNPARPPCQHLRPLPFLTTPPQDSPQHPALPPGGSPEFCRGAPSAHWRVGLAGMEGPCCTLLVTQF